MKKYTTILFIVMLIASTSYLAHAIHERVQIPPKHTILGHYEMMPQAAGGDLRHFITGHQPYTKWAMWPGKSAMSEGTEPHGSFITVYINDVADKSLKMKNGLANNSIILKENYSPAKKLAAITVMYKVKGYNPEGGDWFWAKYGPSFEILAEGKVKGCLDCHRKAEGNDYIFTGDVK